MKENSQNAPMGVDDPHTRMEHTADHEHYSLLVSDISRAINEKFPDCDRGTSTLLVHKTGQSMALMWKIVPNDMKTRGVEVLYN